MKFKLVILLAIVIASNVYSQNLSWTKINLDLGDSISTILQDKSGRLIIQSEKGTFIVKNLTETTRIDTFLPDTVKISCLALDTNGIIYAGTFEDGIYYFTEGDKQWTFVSEKLENQNIRTIAISNKNQVAVGTTLNLLFTLNFVDRTWRKIKSLESDHYLSFLKYDENGNLFGGRQGNLYEVLKDHLNEDNLHYLDVGCYGVIDINFYNQKSYVSTSNCCIFYSIDSSKTWVQLYDGIDSVSNITNTLISVKEEIIVLSKTEGIFYSNNNGTSFEENNLGLSSKKVIKGIILSDQRVIVFIENDGFYISPKPLSNPIKSKRWINRGKYLERKAHSGVINSIKFSNDGKKIFTISRNELKIWDLQTGMLKMQINTPSQNLINMQVSNDDSTLVANYNYSIYEDTTFQIVTRIYQIEKDSLLFTLNYHGMKPWKYSFPLHRMVQAQEINSEFDFNSKILYSSCQLLVQDNVTSSTEYYSTGSFHKLIISETGYTDSIKYQHPIFQFKILNGNKMLLINNEHYSQSFGPNESGSYKKSNEVLISDIYFNTPAVLFNDRDASNLKNPNYAFANSVHYLASANRIASLLSTKKLLLWSADSLKFLDSVYLPWTPDGIEFSHDGKILMVGSPYGVEIYSYIGMRLLDSINVSWSMETDYRIANSKTEAETFAFSGVNGMLRLYKFKQSSIDSINTVPLTELGTSLYKDSTGGLYPNGQNSRPEMHEVAGMEEMKKVLPMDQSGNVDLKNGKIVMLSVGESNTTLEFSRFKALADDYQYKKPELVIVNGAQDGQTAGMIRDENDSYWSVLNQKLQNASVSNMQVQVVWLKESDTGPRNNFPLHAQTLTNELAEICRIIKSKFPKVRLCYLSSRTYGGYATNNLNPEPMAYESGFAVKWLIQTQIEGDASLNFSEADPAAPWLSWGPYLWANGTKPRRDNGLVWLREDFADDGTHPSALGAAKVAELLLDFFTNDETTKYWFTNKYTSVQDDANSPLNFKLYPSPATDYIEISGFNPPAMSWVEDRIRIYNALGEIVLTAGAIHEQPLRIDVSGLPPGLYFVRLGNITRKFVKM